MKLYTIGYQEKDIDEFVYKLKTFDISVLIDVREIPISRKKGFSKTHLSQYLEGNGIQYIHFRDLGSPKAIRDKLKSDRDYDYFFKEYHKYIKSQVKIVKELFQIVSDNICCLMCYERLPDRCHRSIVAEEVIKIDNNGLMVKHI